jgi:glycerophosphoryl diester phosphodiesterase
MTASRTQQSKKNPLAWLTMQPFAHRGLHDGGKVPENSMAAFNNAINEGHGIELDVQAAFDGVAMVFHDASLERLTDFEGSVLSYGSARLMEMRLKDSDQLIPSLDHVLEHVAGRVPIIIEAKSPDADFHPLCFSIRRALEGYRGPVAIMSFDPRIISWFHRNAPRIIRGLVLTDESTEKTGVLGRLGLPRLMSIWQSKPNFMAYDVRSLPSTLSRKLRDNHIPLLTWTVRTPEQREIAREHADNIIYEKIVSSD